MENYPIYCADCETPNSNDAISCKNCGHQFVKKYAVKKYAVKKYVLIIFVICFIFALMYTFSNKDIENSSTEILFLSLKRDATLLNLSKYSSGWEKIGEGWVKTGKKDYIINSEEASQRIYNHLKVLSGLTEKYSFNRKTAKFISDLSEFNFLVHEEKDIPIITSLWNGEPCLIVHGLTDGTIYNKLKLTTKQRAAMFAESVLLPNLKNFDRHFFEESIPSYGISGSYGSKNFTEDDNRNLASESVALFVTRKDCHDYVSKNITQEELMRRSGIFLSVEGRDFVRIEISLD